MKVISVLKFLLRTVTSLSFSPVRQMNKTTTLGFTIAIVSD